jgi:hypothetical protein
VDKQAESDIVSLVMFAEADEFRLCGQFHNLIFEEKNFRTSKNAGAGHINETGHIYIFEYVNMFTH